MPQPDPRGQPQFFERSPWNRRWFAFVLAALFLVIDYLTGPYVQFPILFIIPVMLMAWNCGIRCAVGLAFLLCLARFEFQFLWGFPFSLPVTIVNTLLRFSVLSLLGVITARLGDQARLLRQRVKVLEGILPICGFCKDIRNPDGEWQKIEAFVTQNSEAKFSHGFCPSCGVKHYGDFYQDPH